MRDYRSLPAWRRGTSVAHDVCALLSACGLADTEQGRKLRRTAIAVPSLIAEAFLGLSVNGSEAALEEVDLRLVELLELLRQDVGGDPSDREALLVEVTALQTELQDVRILQQA